MSNKYQSKPVTPPLQKPPEVNRDPLLLHPIFRDKVKEVIRQLHEMGLPFEVFEGYRSPARQSYLYAQGRTRPGKVITKAQAWESYHQFGMAADIVLHPPSGWTWEAPEETWDRLHDVGEFYELEPISFKKPHLQLAGLDLSELKSHLFPGGGDNTWWENLESEIKKG